MNYQAVQFCVDMIKEANNQKEVSKFDNRASVVCFVVDWWFKKLTDDERREVELEITRWKGQENEKRAASQENP